MSYKKEDYEIGNYSVHIGQGDWYERDIKSQRTNIKIIKGNNQQKIIEFSKNHQRINLFYKIPALSLYLENSQVRGLIHVQVSGLICIKFYGILQM